MTHELAAITFSGSIQNPFGFQGLLCDLFGWPKEKLRCKADDVGGGFGCKNQLQPEHAMVVLACEKLQRTIKWINDRTGSFMSDAHARDLVSTVRLGLDKSGRFTALSVSTIANLGAYVSTNGALIPTLPVAAVLGGAYDLPAVSMEVRAAFTNTVPVDAYRGAGRPEAVYLLERTVDVAARQLGLSPCRIASAKPDQAPPIPYKNALGRVIDTGQFRNSVAEGVLPWPMWRTFEQRAAARNYAIRSRGLGVAYYLESTARPAVRHGTDSVYTRWSGNFVRRDTVERPGARNDFPQIAAALFGIPPDRLSFQQADTRRHHGGRWARRFSVLEPGRNGSVLASRKIIEKGKLIAAQLLEAGCCRY